MARIRAILIANPKTGRYGSRRKPSAKAIQAELRSAGVEADLVLTTGPGHATRIAAQAAGDRISQVIVAGGDGTINEALQSLVGTGTRLGILPCGTANVLARELGLPLEVAAAARVIAGEKVQHVHVGLATDESSNSKRYFLLMAGIGLDAAVVQQVTPGLKRRLGRGAFWVTGLRQLANWNPLIFNLEVNGQTHRATFASIGNAARYGGDLGITPRARLDEPEFEVCIIQTTRRARYLRLLSEAMSSRGLQPDRKDVLFVRAAEVRATGDVPGRATDDVPGQASGDVPVQADGEIIGALPMRFEIAAESLEVIVPR